MSSHLTLEQRQLAERMSDLSEEAWAASWMQDLEFVLWRALLGGSRRFGRLELTDDHLRELRELSQLCQGWIVFADGTEESWVPLVDWSPIRGVAGAGWPR